MTPASRNRSLGGWGGLGKWGGGGFYYPYPPYPPYPPRASERVAHSELHLARGVGDNRLPETRRVAVPDHVVEVDVIERVVNLPEESRGSLVLQPDDVLHPQVEQRL